MNDRSDRFFPSWIRTISLLLVGALGGVAIFQRLTPAPTSDEVIVAIAVPMDALQTQANLEQCVNELGQYMALGNKLFYSMVEGAPMQVYWQEPYLYLPNNARTCNASFDPVGCAKTQPGTYVFELKEIFDGTPALVPVDPNAPPPPPVPESAFNPSSSI